MANIFDYIYWRGDLDFAQSPLNEVDNLIICRLAYLPFMGVAPGSFESSITVSDALKRSAALIDAGAHGFDLELKDDFRLMRALEASRRFGSLHMTGYVRRIDPELEKQFCAMTLRLTDGLYYAAFMGTGNTIVGWKEDFNMAFFPVVPAQTDAAEYLEAAAAGVTGRLFVGGHSKGGNLAVYSSAHCSDAVKARIISVFNNDGPGFGAEFIASPAFCSIKDRLKTFVPQSSVVGMLFEHEENFSVVHSNGVGILQHDLYSWEVTPVSLLLAESLTSNSRYIDMALKEWLRQMSPELREKFIDGFFSILSATGAETFNELAKGKNSLAVLKAIKNTDEETKGFILQAAELLASSLKKSAPAAFEKRAAERNIMRQKEL